MLRSRSPGANAAVEDLRTFVDYEEFLITDITSPTPTSTAG